MGMLRTRQAPIGRPHSVLQTIRLALKPEPSPLAPWVLHQVTDLNTRGERNAHSLGYRVFPLGTAAASRTARANSRSPTDYPVGRHGARRAGPRVPHRKRFRI